MIKGEPITFMGTLWFQVEDNIITVGVNEDGLEAIASIDKVDLPQEGETVEGEEICGELETDDGPINIFAPVSGVVFEVNTAVVDNPAQIVEDPYTEGWLFKIEVEDTDEVNALILGASTEQ